MTRITLLAALALSLAACGFTRGSSAPAVPIPSELTGTVVYRERTFLSTDTQLRVRLEELATRADAPPQFIAETTIPRAGQSPIPFRITLAKGVIDPRRAYTLTARIERGDRLLFINEPPLRVLTGGNPSRVEILVAPTAGRN